jgi:pSer/pThr/pTyr-binding forkhead associated (FHA) protein
MARTAGTDSGWEWREHPRNGRPDTSRAGIISLILASDAFIFFIPVPRGFGMTTDIVGELIPVGGGDPIPLKRGALTVGRRESCNICLKFPNVSGLHCELAYKDAGYWQIRDLGSTNGIKVNGQRVLNRPLRPGDEIAIAKRKYKIQYNLTAAAEAALEAVLTEDEDVFSQSLLEKAGLAKRRLDDDDDD